MKITLGNKKIILFVKYFRLIKVEDIFKKVIYIQVNAKFEIDDYIRLDMKVAIIEVKKEEVDKVYIGNRKISLYPLKTP